MEIKAKAKYIKMSSRKVRLVVDVIRGMEVGAALDQLRFINKRAAKPIEKLIKSGIANATNNYELEENNLYIKVIKVDEGATLKRWKPRAHGRAAPIRKRTSHISLILAEIKDSGEKKAKKQEVEAPIKLDSKSKQDEGIKVKDKVKGDKRKKDELTEEKGKEIIDQRLEGKGKHVKIEGSSHKGFVSRIFRRKSG